MIGTVSPSTSALIRLKLPENPWREAEPFSTYEP